MSLTFPGRHKIVTFSKNQKDGNYADWALAIREVNGRERPRQSEHFAGGVAGSGLTDPLTY